MNKKIFIISGKAHSGKGEVSNIIKKYYSFNDIKSIELQYTFYLKNYIKNILSLDNLNKEVYRTFIQDMGTSIKKINNNFFVSRMIEDINIYLNYFDIIIISDARFDFEIDLIKEKFNFVKSIHVVRNDFDNGLKPTEKIHITEVALDNYNNFDYVISNSGDIELLEREVSKILEDL